MTLNNLIAKIKPRDAAAMRAARARQDRLTKPQGSLGQLEDLSIQVAGITGRPTPVLAHKVVTVMAGDHGVVAEGVGAYHQEVTPQGEGTGAALAMSLLEAACKILAETATFGEVGDSEKDAE